MSASGILNKWPRVKLADYARIVSGATPKTSEPRYWGGDVKWVTPKDVSDLDGYPFLDSTPRTLTEEGLESCSAEVLPINSVLFSSRAPIGLVAINRIPVATNQGFKSFVPDASRLDAGFLYHWLRANRSSLEKLGAGATFKEVSKAVMTRVEIPLPPIGEQKRIAAVLDKADALCRQRQESFQHAQNLLQSVFRHMFGDVRTNAKGFPIVPLSDFVERLEGGKNVNPDSSPSAATKYFILKVSAVTSGSFLAREAKPLPVDFDPPSSYFVRKGDLLISRANTRELVGANAVVTEEPRNLVLPDKLWRLVWRRPKDVDPFFIHYLLRQPYVRRQISERASGTSGSMKNISKPKLLSLEVPFPDLNLQKSFGRLVRSMSAIQQKLQNSYRELDRLVKSLEERAFLGELDLSRLKFDQEPGAAESELVSAPGKVEGRYSRPGSFKAPPEIEAHMLALESKLDGPGDSIRWDENFFKYRTLSQVLRPPFSFADIWEAVDYDFEDPDYETVKDKVFEFVEAGILVQEFDQDRKEIVFRPRS